MSRFENKVALVTGGGTGIGRAVAKAIVAEGGKVVVTGRRRQPLETLADEVPGDLLYVQGDVTDTGDLGNAVKFTVEQFGRLDILINNAGVAFLKPLEQTTDEELDTMVDVNQTGALKAIREALPHLVENNGAVVNVSSTAAGAAMPGTAAYAATKAAVERLTAILAAELGPQGVRVNSVAPGFTDTDMATQVITDEMKAGIIAQTPLGRMGTPEDIAEAVLFMASDDASWITGQSLQSSGGLML